MVKCPYFGFEGSFKLLKAWKFRFYSIKMLACPGCDSTKVSRRGKEDEDNEATDA
jgi:4-hydroxy-3-methylbut-2-en-1-yl diphosphate synthase IspG/GcpE